MPRRPAISQLVDAIGIVKEDVIPIRFGDEIFDKGNIIGKISQRPVGPEHDPVIRAEVVQPVPEHGNIAPLIPQEGDHVWYLPFQEA